MRSPYVNSTKRSKHCLLSHTSSPLSITQNLSAYSNFGDNDNMPPNTNSAADDDGNDEDVFTVTTYADNEVDFALGFHPTGSTDESVKLIFRGTGSFSVPLIPTRSAAPCSSVFNINLASLSEDRRAFFARTHLRNMDCDLNAVAPTEQDPVALLRQKQSNLCCI